MTNILVNKQLCGFLSHITSPELFSVIKIQNVLLMELQKYAYQNGFFQIMPLLMSPITDPLNHQVYPAEIQYENTRLKLTASMIFHKQLSLIPREIEKILIMAPNIRLELATKKSSTNHLLEFSQFDIEMKNKAIVDVMDFVEGLYKYLFFQISVQCKTELEILGRNLPNIDKSFPRLSTTHLPYNKVDAFCDDVSRNTDIPTFIISFKREFYDKEDIGKPGTYLNFDMVYPEGFGEALSGAEREYEYHRILQRMKELNMDLQPFKNYLEMARNKLIPRTAGCGIGVQRLLKYICGKKLIKDVCLFDRSLTTDFIF